MATTDTPPQDFAQWTFEHVRQVIDEAIQTQVTAEGFKANAAFLEEDDHWQDGEYFMGPMGDISIRAAQKEKIKRQFVAVDVVGEVMDNLANALLRREAAVNFTPLEPVPEDAPDETRAKLKEDQDRLLGLISEWWDRIGLWSMVRQAVVRSRWACRGALRVYTPQGSLNEQEGEGGAKKYTLPTGLDLPRALEKLEVSAPRPDEALVYTHPDTRRVVGLFVFQNDAEEKFAELWYNEESAGGEKQTVLRIIGEGEAADAGSSKGIGPVDMQGRLPIAEMKCDLLITEPVRRQQHRLNFFESIIVSVGEKAGFPERYTLNAKPSGIWTTTAPTDGPPLDRTVWAGKTYYLVAMPRTLGAGVLTELRGLDTEAGGIATPGVVFKEPTDPAYAIRGSEHARNTILRSCKQGHLTLVATAEASGVAYEQARSQFSDDLSHPRSEGEAMVRDIISAALAQARLMGAEDVLARYRVVVNFNVTTGPILPSQQQQNSTLVEKGLMSAETAMARNGEEDVDSEVKRIRSSPEHQINLREKQLNLVLRLVGENVPWREAAEIVGLEPADIERLAKVQKLVEQRDDQDRAFQQEAREAEIRARGRVA